MPRGFVGLDYFPRGWRAPELPKSPDARRRLVQRMKRAGYVTIHRALDGTLAVRASQVLRASSGHS